MYLTKNIGSLIRRERAVTFFAGGLFLVGAQEGFAVFLIKSNQKSRQQKCFFAHHPPLQSGQNHGLGKFAPCCAAHVLRFSKHSLCPCSRTTHHVLPAFSRSFPAAVR
ncbi:hypothetical protein [Mucilaginibacter pedocola]|uniref:hypothetical protein n=1 Tax=Mucilaginibacter pedocola TaxID=1792845 RepID=UPI00138FE661|nr:hypothetical protein [Mucilaginibacter pedocola]